MFDVAIIGAGICGCSSAYFLTQEGLSVALIDAEGIASGGSGAAGAFVSPKFVKSGPVKELSEAAFDFALAFYKEHFKEHTRFSELLHLANNELSNERVKYFKEHTAYEQIESNASLLESIKPEALEYEHIALKECALVNAKSLCEALAKDADFHKLHVNKVAFNDGAWHIEGIKAKNLILTTGAHRHLVPMPYYVPRAIFGHRIDIKISTHSSVNIHQFVSISKSDENGVIAIGATHDVHYNPLTSDAMYDLKKGQRELIEKASRTLDLQNIEILNDYTGVRSASIDHLPLVGPVVNAKSAQNYPNLYIINGVGGYGFVQAPYLAKMLSDYLYASAPIDAKLLPSRFYQRALSK